MRPGGNALASSSILVRTVCATVERVGLGQLEDAEAGGRRAVEREGLAVGLRAELDAADILQARDATAGLVVDLDDDVLEVGARR